MSDQHRVAIFQVGFDLSLENLFMGHIRRQNGDQFRLLNGAGDARRFKTVFLRLLFARAARTHADNNLTPRRREVHGVGAPPDFRSR